MSCLTVGIITTVRGHETNKMAYKGKKNGDKKPWFNKDNKPWNKDNKHQNKEAKPKDACITVSKDVKYFCPTGYDGQIC